MELKISGFNKTENNLVTKNATNQSEKSYSFNEVLNSISSNKNKNISTKQDVQQDNKKLFN